MILKGHASTWAEIFAMDILPTGSWLTIGFQEIEMKARRLPGFRFANVTQLLRQKGARVTTLDLFDERADIHWDLNEPVPDTWHEAFDVLLDIGSIEHVFDTRQVLVNYLNLTRLGGFVCLHTPVSGCFDHGLHTFSPEALRKAFVGNGCEVVLERFTETKGKVLWENELAGQDALMWIVARKDRRVHRFTNPQQERWSITRGHVQK